MWKKIILVVLALSLALNAAFAATWALRTLGREGDRRRAKRAASTQKHDIWSPLHRRLGVTMEQWRKIEPHMREFLRKMEERQERISKVRHGMLDLLFSPDVTQNAIEKQQAKVLKAFRETQDLVLGHILTEKDYLTSEQEKKLRKLLRKRMETSGPGNPPIAPANQSGGRGVGKAFKHLEKNSRSNE